MTNLLHVVSASGVDELQIARVMIGELTSFFAVLIYVKLSGAGARELQICVHKEQK